jgi:hypothetical protein
MMPINPAGATAQPSVPQVWSSQAWMISICPALQVARRSVLGRETAVPLAAALESKPVSFQLLHVHDSFN